MINVLECFEANDLGYIVIPKEYNNQFSPSVKVCTEDAELLFFNCKIEVTRQCFSESKCVVLCLGGKLPKAKITKVEFVQ